MSRPVVYVKIVEHGMEFQAAPWTPWTTSPQDTGPMIEQMALRQFIRNRGGIANDERVKVEVYSYDDTTPLYPSGAPKVCRRSGYTLTRSEPAPVKSPTSPAKSPVMNSRGKLLTPEVPRKSH